MAYEFAEAARETAQKAHHVLNTAERHGEEWQIEDAVGEMREVVEELSGALREARDLLGELEERARELGEALDPDREPPEGPLEEQFENARFAQDDEAANMNAEEIL